jgi:hypothetical protein
MPFVLGDKAQVTVPPAEQFGSFSRAEKDENGNPKFISLWN